MPWTRQWRSGSLAVTYPQAGNLGGGGFMLIRMADGTSTFIDFREKAPQAASRNMYVGPDGKLTRDGLVGWRASRGTGSVRGFEYARKKNREESLGALLQPAIGWRPPVTRCVFAFGNS